MGVVAPVSAVGAASCRSRWAWPPASVPSSGLARHRRCAPRHLAGLPGAGRRRQPAAGLLDGVLAGLGFGLLFAALGQVPEEAGFWPLAVAQASALPAVVLAATALAAPWRPTARSEVTGGLLAGTLRCHASCVGARAQG